VSITIRVYPAPIETLGWPTGPVVRFARPPPRGDRNGETRTCLSRIRAESVTARGHLCSAKRPGLVLVEQPQLEHARCVEAFDPQHRAGSSDRGSGRHQADELRANYLGTPSGSLPLDPLHDLVEGGRLVVLDVHA